MARAMVGAMAPLNMSFRVNGFNPDAFHSRTGKEGGFADRAGVAAAAVAEPLSFLIPSSDNLPGVERACCCASDSAMVDVRPELEACY